MEYQNRWYLSILNLDNIICSPLEADITTDYLIVWGGVAWLHAAQALLDRKCKVVLLEKSICGGGMSGRSGGFLTPDSELWLRQIEKRYGRELTKKIRNFGDNGQSTIVDNIHRYALHCDLRDEDSLLLGIGEKGKKAVLQEYQDRSDFGFDAEHINEKTLKKHNTWCCYTTGVRYTNCYAINPMQYCQELKKTLIKKWLQVHEFTHVHQLQTHKAITNKGSVTFKHAIVCAGKAESAIFPTQAKNIYGIQNYIAISEPLTDTQITSMMPSGECMCRDTQMVFTYYRLTGDKRIVLGGGSAVSSFQPFEILSEHTIYRVIQGFKREFPAFKNVLFPSYWSGRIQATRDLMPIVDHDTHHPHHMRVQGAVWLPRAAACGRFAVEKLFHEEDTDLCKVFNQNRSFFVPFTTNSVLLKPFIFGISNAHAMFG